MHIKIIRNSILFLIVLLFVFSSRSLLANGLFAIGVGAWTMTIIFKFIFRSVLDSEYFTWDRYLTPPQYILYDLLSETTRKQTTLIIIWWPIGIFAAIVIYKFLTVLLISS